MSWLCKLSYEVTIVFNTGLTLKQCRVNVLYFMGGVLILGWQMLLFDTIYICDSNIGDNLLSQVEGVIRLNGLMISCVHIISMF